MKHLITSKATALVLVVIMVVGAFTTGTVTAYATSGDTVVYITKTGECYHVGGCSSLKRSKIETTLQSAVDRGYKPCSKCNPGTLDASTSISQTTSTASTKSSSSTTTASKSNTNSSAVDALKTYKGNTKEFNAYDYYNNNADLQTAIGADGDALLKHYNEYGKKEGRVAIGATSTTSSVSTTTKSKGNSDNFDTYNIPEQQNTSESYVLNTKTQKFHYPSCKDVVKIKPDNYSTSSLSRDTLMSQGYSPCGHCNP